MTRKGKWPTAVDLYSGCGAVTEALKRRHFRVVAAVDNDPVACRTYRKNHPTVRLYEHDIRRVSAEDIRKELLNGRNLDLLIVCAPCQPFSSQGEKNIADGRARLVLSAVRFAEVLKPKLILFENVPGLATPRFATVRKDLGRRLRQLGYEVGDAKMADAADYGVPQRRQRCILLAKRRASPPHFPTPITPFGERRSVRSAFGGLQGLRAGTRSAVDPLHCSRKHHPLTIERLLHIPEDGGSRSSLPERLVLDCHKDYRGHPDV